MNNIADTSSQNADTNDLLLIQEIMQRICQFMYIVADATSPRPDILAEPEEVITDTLG